MADQKIPEGFERHFRQSLLTGPWEPLYSKRDGRTAGAGTLLPFKAAVTNVLCGLPNHSSDTPYAKRNPEMTDSPSTPL
jgi:hypothetical protein